MHPRNMVLLVMILVTTTGYAQKNFSYTPEKPKPGDVIEFTYESAGDLAGSLEPVEAIVYGLGSNGRSATDLVLKRKGYKYTGTITTDTSLNFIYLAFFVDRKFDNNNDEGYFIHLYDDDKITEGSYAGLSQFYQLYAPGTGVARNNEKALAMIQEEMQNYPANRKQHVPAYLKLVMALKKPDASAIVQKEIEQTLKNGLVNESDYSSLEELYTIAKLPEQTRLINGLKKERFPNGSWVVGEAIRKFNAEADPSRKKELLAGIKQKIDTDSAWSGQRKNFTSYQLSYLNSYIAKKDWAGYKAAVAEAGITNKDQLASQYNNAAWRIQESGENLDLAEELSEFAVLHARAETKKPSATRPMNMTEKQWQRQRENTYAMYADTYGMVMYKQGKFKKALPFAKDAMLHWKAEVPDYNTTYALLAEKALPAKQYKKELEQFVVNGKASNEIKEILKRLYKKEHKDPEGFNTYFATLEQASYLKMLEELRKSMLSQAAPSFALLDLDGKEVSASSLKGKVVVVDFWATWCGPCKASFPGMQKMVSKYKEKDDVKFIFVDTWERVENKEKNAADFIASNKYSFHVLMDNDNKVVEDFKVEGIPTKFVIDKDGLIRFKSVGFDGSDDKLVKELTAMIEMAADPSKKAF